MSNDLHGNDVHAWLIEHLPIGVNVRRVTSHPWLDEAWSDDDDGNRYRSVALRPSLRRRWFGRA